MIELQFHPEYGWENEYIELFYKALEPYGLRARDRLIIRDKILREQAPQLDIIQIQWCPERLWRGGSHRLQHLHVDRILKYLRVARLWKDLRLAKRLGLRVIWTVHDFNHHDGDGFVDRWGYRVLARSADLCICHSDKTRRDVLRRYWVRPERTVTMPMGNYDGVFPPAVSRSRTLSDLGLPQDRKTLVCFGLIRPYKGFDLALDALRVLDNEYQLIVAGRPLEPRFGNELRERAQGMPHVRLIMERVDKQRLADFIHAADCVIMPYRRITGSGALLASLTLARGVVASDLPFFREILAQEPEAGVLSTPGDARDIARAINAFFSIAAESRHAAARRIADRYDWNLVIRPVADWLQRTFPEKVQASASAAGAAVECAIGATRKRSAQAEFSYPV
jgi:glycosyltransferase involved in cell wall biosynthesis